MEYAANYAQSSQRRKNVSIHPTAHIEASIIGDNVTIGPKACVRNSIVGNHVSIGDHANVLSSTLGDRSHVTPRTFLVWSAVYPDAVINNYKLQSLSSAKARQFLHGRA